MGTNSPQHVVCLDYRLLKARLESGLGLGCAFTWCRRLEKLPVDWTAVTLLAVHESRWTHVHFTCCLALLKLHEATLEVLCCELLVVDEELATPIRHVARVYTVQRTEITLGKVSTHFVLSGLAKSNEHETERGHLETVKR